MNRDGNEEKVQIDRASAPALLTSPIFPPPGVLSGDRRTGATIKGILITSWGPDPTDIARERGADSTSMALSTEYPVEFAKMLGKIAHCFAYTQGAIEVPKQSRVVPALLDETNDIGTWVGTVEGPITQHPGLLHALTLRRGPGSLVVDVQLFAQAQTPTYQVVLQSPLL